jgi:Protein of unknown function (DUF4197)
MNKLFAGIAFFAAINFASAQNNILNQVVNSVTGGGGLSNDQIIKGLKEALNVGTNNSTAAASKLDGFYKNPLIKIPFPAEAKNMEKQLRSIGMGKEVDKFTKTLNRAAEDAAKKAAPIFLDAVKKMTITDGLSILNGGNEAATNYLKGASGVALKAAFKPVIQASLQKVEITKYWTPLTKSYNKLPFAKKVNPDLNEYVTQRAMDGLFKLVAKEELKIRTDPAARINDILKKVFGK